MSQCIRSHSSSLVMMSIHLFYMVFLFLEIHLLAPCFHTENIYSSYIQLYSSLVIAPIFSLKVKQKIKLYN